MKKYKNQYDWQQPTQDIIDKIQYLYDSGFGGGKKIAREVGVSEHTIWKLRDKGILIFNRTKTEMLSLSGKNRTHSEETRNKISKSRQKFLTENPNMVPYKLNHKSNGESYPERYFREWLQKENISFEQEYKFKLYSFDFLINGKIDLEIDGDQHILDEKIKEHDKKRDKITINNGYLVKRILWSEYKRLSKIEQIEFLQNLKQFLTSQ